MERKMDGKEFEQQCQSCPYQLAFNRQIKGDQDEVTVECRLPKCILEPKKVKVK